MQISFVSRKTSVIILSICAFFTLWVYNPARFYFLNDDFVHIILTQKGEFFQHRSARPVHEILLWFDILLWGKNPFGYHLSLLVIHLLCGFFLFKLAALIFERYGNMQKDEAITGAILVTTLFLVYAFHSEAVLWILGGGASLCTLFFLLSLLAYIKKERKGFFLLSIVWFLLSLFTYESVWIAPFIISAISYAEIRVIKKRSRKELTFVLIYFICFIAYLVIRYVLLGEIASRYETSAFITWHPLSLLAKYNSLLARCFVAPSLSTKLFVSSYAMVFIILLMSALVYIKRNRKDILFTLLLFGLLASLVPVLSLGIDTHDTESERFLYLPSVFTSCWLVYLLLKAGISRKVKRLIFAALLLYNAVFVFSSSRDFSVAGNMCKQSLKAIDTNIGHGNRVCLNQLPLQFRGAKIFYLGLNEGLYWLYQTDTSLVKVNNYAEVLAQEKYLGSFYRTNFNFQFRQIAKNDSCNMLQFVYDSSYFKQ